MTMLLVLSLLPCTFPPQPHCLWMLNSGINYPGLDPRSVLLKGISRTVKTSLSYKKSLAGFRNGASITLCGFVVCNVSYTEIFMRRDAENERKYMAQFLKPTAKYVAHFTEMSSTWWLMVIILLHAHTNLYGSHFTHLRNTENICIFKGGKASALQYCYTLILQSSH